MPGRRCSRPGDAYLASHADRRPAQLGAAGRRAEDGDPCRRRGRPDRAPGAAPRWGRPSTPASAYLRALAQVTLGERSRRVRRCSPAGDSFARTGRALAGARPTATSRPTPRRCGRSWPTSRPATSTSPACRSPTPRSCWSGWRRSAAWRCDRPGRSRRRLSAPALAVYCGPTWGYSSAGRAPRWQRGGRRFEPD